MQFEKNICVFKKKNMFFSHKKIGLQKKTLKKCFFFLFFFFKTHLKEITS